ncbi:MAG: triose-phosphate isomerase [candidate division Zixibacteria bacterium]|nr:triose-phosphate isomerase [candidate division Zixibacteria bacterium]
MRKTLVAGNWKMNMVADEALALAKGVVQSAGEFGQTEALVCPPYIWLSQVNETIKKSTVKLGAQDLFWEDKGAFTGEISAAMIKSAGCDYVIVGHSERRQFFGETDRTVNKRLNKAVDSGLIAIVCLGENFQQRESGLTSSIISSQFENAFLNFDQFDKVVVAYEPIWAIGTGKTASPEQAQEVHQQLRGLLEQKTDKYDTIRILYGGSVKPGNAAELISKPDIDGFLVGGASLKAADFVGIIKSSL